MICEMCGKKSEWIKTVFIEGTELKVCKECSKFGESTDGTNRAKSSTTAPVSRAVVNERLEARERRMRTRDVYKDMDTSEDLIPDYAAVIKDARRERNMKQEDLAAKLNEKATIIAKIENGDMVPNDKLIKKLEKELDIKLTEKVSSVASSSSGSGGKGLTLGDLIKKA